MRMLTRNTSGCECNALFECVLHVPRHVIRCSSEIDSSARLSGTSIRVFLIQICKCRVG